MPLKKPFKILIWILATLVVLLSSSVIVAKIIFTKEKLLAMILPKVEASLGRKVALENVSLSFWGGPGIDLEGLQISNTESFSDKNILELQQASVRVRLLPLLKKRIEVSKLILKNPALFIEKNKSGVFNYERQPTTPIPPGDTIQSSLPYLLIFENLEIQNARVVYKNQIENNKIILDQTSLEFKTKEVKQGKVSGQGKMSLNSIELVSRGRTQKYAPPVIKADYKLTFDFGTSFLELSPVEVRWGKLEAEMKSRLTNAFSDQARLELELTSKAGRISDLLTFLPAEKQSQIKDLIIQGNFDIQAHLSNDFSVPKSTQVKGYCSLKELEIKSRTYSQSLVIPDARLDFTDKTLNFKTSGARMGENPVEILLQVTDFENPSLNSNLKGTLNLEVLKPFLVSQGNLSGELKFNARADGKVKIPEKMSMSGDIILERINYSSAAAFPVQNLSGKVSLKNDRLVLTNFNFSSGSSKFKIEGEAKNLLSSFWSKGKTLPVLNFNLSSSYLNLDSLFPTTAVTQGSKTQKSSTSPILFFPKAYGHLKVDRAIFRELEFTDFAGDLKFENGVLKLENVSGKLYTGEINGSAIYDMRDFESPKFTIQTKAKNIETNDFLSRFTNIKDYLFGKLDLAASFSGQGKEISEIKKGLVASGTGTLTQGKLLKFEMASKLSDFLRIKELGEDQEIKTLKNSFKIDSGKLFFEDFSLIAKNFDCSLAGYMTLDGELNYIASFTLSPELSNRFNTLGELSTFLKNEQGLIVLDIKLTGPASAPKFTLDTSRAEKRAREKLQKEKEKLSEELRQKMKESLQDLFKKKP